METKRTQFLQIVGNCLLALTLGIVWVLLGLSIVVIVVARVFIIIFLLVEKKIEYQRWRWLQKGVDALCDTYRKFVV